MSLSVLEKNYCEESRPHSQNELVSMRLQLVNKHRLSKVRVSHNKCRHFYTVKKNGRKEKDILESDGANVGNCSVCWKLSRTPRKLSDRAKQLVVAYTEEFEGDPILHFENIELESDFYTWLYNEFNPERNKEYFGSK